MDAPYYTGSDNRDALTTPDDGDCASCGATWLQRCTDDCECDWCLRKRLRDAAQAMSEALPTTAID